MRATARVVLVVLGVLCVIAFSSYNLSYATEDTNPPTEIKRTTVGLEFAPVYERVETHRESPTGSRHSLTTNVRVLSWSTAVLLTGIACFRAAWGLRRERVRSHE